MKFGKFRILILVLIGFLSSLYGGAQVISNGTINASITTQNPFLDASSFFDLSVDPSSSGKGLVFPRTDLTSFSFTIDFLGFGSFPTAFDGMIVYNTGVGDTPANQGVAVTSVAPGFYYFSNPTGTTTVTGGQWVRMNDSNISSTPVGSGFPVTPSGGDVFYRTDSKNYYYYNGTDWISVSNTPHGVTLPLASDSRTGDVFYETNAGNPALNVLKIFDGTNWVSVGSSGISNGSITEPKLQTSGGGALTGGTPGQVLTSTGDGRFKWTSSGAAPSGTDLPVPVPVEGSTFYEKDTDILWVSDGTSWVKLNGVVTGTSAPGGTGSIGETYYDTANHIYYVYDGDSWVPVGGSVTTSGTEPVSANDGDVYYNSTDGNIYYYNGTDWALLNGVATGAAEPTSKGSESVGETYYDTVNHTYYVYDGNSWKPLSGSVADGSITVAKLQDDGGQTLGNGSDGQVLTSTGDGQFKWTSSGAAPSGADPSAVANPMPGSTYYNTTDGTVYVYTGSIWTPVAGGESILVSATAPSPAANNDVYFNTDDNTFYKYNQATTIWAAVNSPVSIDATMTGDGTATSPLGINKANISLSDFASATNDISLGGKNITNLAAPTQIYDAATKKYVDDAVGNAVGGDMLKATYDQANIAEQLVGINATQTLSNKTLTSPVINSPSGLNKSDVGLNNVTNNAQIYSLGGLTAQTQTFATGTSGTAPAFSSATSTHTLNIPMASGVGVTAGLLSKTDYDSFNGKASGGATFTLGSTSVALGSTITTVSGLTSVTSTGFTGSLNGNASTATNLDGGSPGDLLYQSAANITSKLGVGSNGDVLKVVSGVPAWSSAGTGDMTLTGIQTITGAKTFGAVGDVSKLIIAGSSSGSTVLNAAANASGTAVLPASGGTLATLAGTETLTNKTIAAGSNTISGLTNANLSGSAAISDANLATISTALKVSNSATTATSVNTASAIVARDASGNFTAGTITANLTGIASSATNLAGLSGGGEILYQSGNNTTSRLGAGILGQVLTSNGTGAPSWTSAGTGDMTTNTAQIITGAKTFGAVGDVSKLIIAGSSSGSTVLNAAANASGTAVLPASGGTLATLAGTETLTNKTIAAGSNTISGLTNANLSGSAAISDANLATISTALKVSNSATTATSVNTASAIVARDASGNFSAGTITSTNVAINATNAAPAASAALDITSTDKGMLIPRMTANQRDNIDTPANGLMVYVTDDNTFYYYKSNAWTAVGGGGGGFANATLAAPVTINQNNNNVTFTTGTGKFIVDGDFQMTGGRLYARPPRVITDGKLEWNNDDVQVVIACTVTLPTAGKIDLPDASLTINKYRVIALTNVSGGALPMNKTAGETTGVYTNENFTSAATNSVTWFISDGLSWRRYNGR